MPLPGPVAWTAAIAGLSAWLHVPARHRWVLLLFMGLHGAGTEFLQWLLPTGRNGCLRDVGLDLDSDVYYISRLPVEMNPWEIACVLGAAVAIALAATLYPALVAARLRPVEGLRYDHG